MKSKTISLPETGEVILRKNRQNKRIRITIKPPGVVRVTLPEKESFKHAEDFVKSKQDWIKKNIEKLKKYQPPEEIIDINALKQEAENYLPPRAEFLSYKTGLKYRKLKLFKSKRCWGMCMGDDSIKLNVQLMRLPPELIDYVILHELAHIRVKNHSRQFYDFLGTLIPEPKAWSKNLKKYALSGYIN